MIGDSLAARAWGRGGPVVSSTGNGFVVSGGPQNAIATVTTITPHALIPGNYIQLFNDGDSGYSAPLNGAVLRVLTTASATQFTVSATDGGKTMSDGDYSRGYLGQGWQVRSMYQVTNESWLQWLNHYMNGRFTFVANYSLGGTISSVGVTLIPKIKAGPKADYAFIQYCTNDINAITPPQSAACLKNIQTIVSAVESLDMVPILCAPPAIGDIGAIPADPASATKTAALIVVRDEMRQLAAADKKIVFLDTFDQTTDIADSLGRNRNQYAPVDGLHLSSLGASTIAKHFADALKLTIPVDDPLPTSPTDDASIDVNAKNIVQNGFMTQASGSIASNSLNTISGTAPTGWSAQAFGGTSVNPITMSITADSARADMLGHALDVTVTKATVGQGFQFGTNGAGGSSFSSRMHVGEWYQCGYQVTARAEIRNLTLSGQIFLNFGNDNAPSIYFMAATTSTFDNGALIEDNEQRIVISQPFYLPAIPTQGAYLFINGSFSGSIRDQAFSIGRAFCHSTQDPYS